MNNEIIYLDNEFIIDKYEEHTGKTAHTTYSKSTNVKTGINIGAQLGASMSESFTYPLRAKDMYKECKKDMGKYPTCKTLKDIGIDECSNIFWINGIIGLSKITHKSRNQITGEGYTFRIEQEECECTDGLTLVVDNTYFTSGYSQLLDSAFISTDSFRIKARILVKLLGTNFNNKYIATPLLIEKTGYDLKNNTSLDK